MKAYKDQNPNAADVTLKNDPLKDIKATKRGYGDDDEGRGHHRGHRRMRHHRVEALAGVGLGRFGRRFGGPLQLPRPPPLPPIPPPFARPHLFLGQQLGVQPLQHHRMLFGEFCGLLCCLASQSGRSFFVWHAYTMWISRKPEDWVAENGRQKLSITYVS